MALQRFLTPKAMQEWCRSQRVTGKRIGVVPTMGFLHAGHASLITHAANECDEVIVTIFVNPTQFAPNEDLTTYPRNLQGDELLALTAGATAIFIPSNDEMYPQNYSTYITVGGIAEKFEGMFRPTHFRGVATIVAKLLNITLADTAYFGQKDYQQTLVIKKLCSDLNIPTKITICETIREADNLAMSSRNVYLDTESRQQAKHISASLAKTGNAIEQGIKKREEINSILRNGLLEIKNIQIDYCAVVETDSLNEPEYFKAGTSVVCLVAVKIGTARLIDNMIFTIPNE